MDDAQTLIDQLTTLAGMIMEDASAVAVAVGSGVDQSAKLKDLAAAARDVSTLTMAAEGAMRRFGQ